MTQATRPGPLRVWWMGARPRTLGAAIVPVVVGTAAAGHADPVHTPVLLVVALGLQVGVNYANDYFDGVRGVDTPERVGPARLVASGLASARSVLAATLVCLAVAAAAGMWLALTVSLWLLAVGTAALLAALAYSGGPRPYASMGLGEVIVFAFFGPAATAGSAFVQAGHIPAPAWWASVSVGLLAAAILVANNLRDIPTDAKAGKHTLAVRVGDARTRLLYRVIVATAFAVPLIGVAAGVLRPQTLIVLAAVPFAIRPFMLVGRARGPQLVGLLMSSAVLHVVMGVALAVGLWLS